MENPRPIELPPMQLRLPMDTAELNASVSLVLSGMTVLAEVTDGNPKDFELALARRGLHPATDVGGFYRISVRELPALLRLDPGIDLHGDAALWPVLELLAQPPVDGAPAVVDIDESDDSVVLSWTTETGTVEHHIPSPSAGVLMAAGVTFTATDAAWGVLLDAGVLPDVIGMARATVSGIVEITAPVPQLVEGAPLPGLFRLDNTRFGIAMRFAPLVASSPGFVWSGPAPRPEIQHLVDLPVTVELSEHHRADLTRLVNRLSVDRSAVLVWDAGLGRRIMALTAIEALDSWPLVILCPPSQVWTWQRHLELLGRTGSLNHDDTDARIVTYDELAAGAKVGAPAALILDDLCAPEAAQPAVRDALARLAHLELVRVAVTATWPEDEEDACALMSLLRPGEFTTQVRLAQRYPAPSRQRAREHLGAYLQRRGSDDAGTVDTGEFRRTTVRVLRPNDAQLQALAQIAWNAPSQPRQALARQLALVSAGSEQATSPKLAVAAELATTAHNAGRRVAVATRDPRAHTMLRGLLRHLGAQPFDGAGAVPVGGPVIVRFDTALPDLRWADDVIVLDWPLSTTTLDTAVGSAAAGPGPQRVTVLHLAGTVDDRVALLAARRRENGVAADQLAAPDRDELAFLLGIDAASMRPDAPLDSHDADGNEIARPDEPPLRLRPSVMRPPRRP